MPSSSFHILESTVLHLLFNSLVLEPLMGISFQNSQVRLSFAKVHSLIHFVFSFLLGITLEALSFFPCIHLLKYELSFACSLFDFLFLLLPAFMLGFIESAHCVFLLLAVGNLPCALLILNDIFVHSLFHLIIGLVTALLYQV